MGEIGSRKAREIGWRSLFGNGLTRAIQRNELTRVKEKNMLIRAKRAKQVQEKQAGERCIAFIRY